VRKPEGTTQRLGNELVELALLSLGQPHEAKAVAEHGNKNRFDQPDRDRRQGRPIVVVDARDVVRRKPTLADHGINMGIPFAVRLKGNAQVLVLSAEGDRLTADHKRGRQHLPPLIVKNEH